jgi:hypothetical protein
MTTIIKPKDPFEESILLTQWALEKAWKIAVRTKGITDWSVTQRDHPEAEHEVEILQMHISKMLLDNVHELRRDKK